MSKGMKIKYGTPESREKKKLAYIFRQNKELERELYNINKNILDTTVNEYMALVKPYLTDNELDKSRLIKDAQSNPNLIYKMRRLNDRIEFLSDALAKKLDKDLTKILINDYIYIFDETRLNPTLGTPNELLIRQALLRPWTEDNINYSTRIWRNRDTLVRTLKQEITTSMITGQSIDKTVKRVQSRIGQSQYNCQRLVRTETMHCYTEATKEVYRQEGVERIQILTGGAPRTCPICEAIENMGTVNLDQAELNGWLPPIHPNCRCCIIPIRKE